MAQSFNINSADLGDLMQASQIKRDTAESILEYRKARGHIGSWEELAAVPGVSRGLIEALRHDGWTLDGPGPVEEEIIALTKLSYSRGGEGRMGGEDAGE